MSLCGHLPTWSCCFCASIAMRRRENLYASGQSFSEYPASIVSASAAISLVSCIVRTVSKYSEHPV
jgi:hypothetical protein